MQVTRKPFTSGEVVTRGVHVTSGYWRDTAATAAAFDSSGWFHTGDVGYFDRQGSLHLCGRIKDVIKSGGENVHAAEVESVLLQIAGVRAAAVVGLPHERFGEAVAALLQVNDAHSFVASSHSTAGTEAAQVVQGADADVLWMPEGSLGRLRRRCCDLGLTRYKVPRAVAVTAHALPCTATGKIIKADVKRWLRPQPKL